MEISAVHRGQGRERLHQRPRTGPAGNLPPGLRSGHGADNGRRRARARRARPALAVELKLNGAGHGVLRRRGRSTSRDRAPCPTASVDSVTFRLNQRARLLLKVRLVGVGGCGRARPRRSAKCCSAAPSAQADRASSARAWAAHGETPRPVPSAAVYSSPPQLATLTLFSVRTLYRPQATEPAAIRCDRRVAGERRTDGVCWVPSLR